MHSKFASHYLKNGIVSTLRPFVGDLTKRKRARIRLQLVSAQIRVLTTFSFQGVRFVRQLGTTLIVHEENRALTVLYFPIFRVPEYFPFRARTPELARRLVSEGKSVREIASVFNVHPATIYRLAAIHRTEWLTN
jgi:hypothetical protein